MLQMICMPFKELNNLSIFLHHSLTNDSLLHLFMLHITIVIPSGLLWYGLTETHGLASTICVKNWLPYHFKW